MEKLNIHKYKNHSNNRNRNKNNSLLIQTCLMLTVGNDLLLADRNKTTISVSTACKSPRAPFGADVLSKSSFTYLAKMTNFLFGFQGAVKLKPSGTRTNVRPCAHIAKQGLRQMLALEICLEKCILKSFKALIKTLSEEFTYFFFF